MKQLKKNKNNNYSEELEISAINLETGDVHVIFVHRNEKVLRGVEAGLEKFLTETDCLSKFKLLKIPH